MLKGSGDFSPPDPVECPESCPHAHPSRNPKKCRALSLRCIYEWDKDEYGDIKFHERF